MAPRGGYTRRLSQINFPFSLSASTPNRASPSENFIIRGGPAETDVFHGSHSLSALYNANKRYFVELKKYLVHWLNTLLAKKRGQLWIAVLITQPLTTFFWPAEYFFSCLTKWCWLKGMRAIYEWRTDWNTDLMVSKHRWTNMHKTKEKTQHAERPDKTITRLILRRTIRGNADKCSFFPSHRSGALKIQECVPLLKFHHCIASFTVTGKSTVSRPKSC